MSEVNPAMHEIPIPLTITIPTFNRQEKLLNQVRALLPQMGDDDRLVILDNATPNFHPEDHHELADPRVELKINSVNIGGNGNIVNCFFCGQTDWMWLLSDDDPVVPNALETIRAEIAAAPDACFIAFWGRNSKRARIARRRCRGLEEFIDGIYDFGNTLLISNCVYNRKVVLPNISYAYNAIWMNAPHLAIVIQTLKSGALAVYSDREVVDWHWASAEENWPHVPLFHLLNLTGLIEDRRLATKLFRAIARETCRPRMFIAQLCYTTVKFPYDWRVRVFARHVLGQYGYFLGVRSKITGTIYLILLRFPRFAVFLFSLLYRIRNKSDMRMQNKSFGMYH